MLGLFLHHLLQSYQPIGTNIIPTLKNRKGRWKVRDSIWNSSPLGTPNKAIVEKEMAIHSSILAWRIPWTEEPGRLQSIGSQDSHNDLATKPAPPPPITSEITVHRHCNKYNNNNRKFEILYELPKCDTETGSEQMLLENDSDRRLTQVCHKPSI